MQEGNRKYACFEIISSQFFIGIQKFRMENRIFVIRIFGRRTNIATATNFSTYSLHNLGSTIEPKDELL